MAPFSFPNPFRSGHCMNYEQQTPTSSPESQNLWPQQKGGQPPFSGLLRKPRSVRVTLQAAAPAVSSTCLCGAQVPPTPASLTVTDDHSTNDRIPTSGLRRRSSSYTDPRTVAQQQPKLKALRVHIPLLPSPLQIDEPSSTSTSYFYFQNPRLKADEAKQIEDNYVSYEDIRILSCYCENSRHCDDFETSNQKQELTEKITTTNRRCSQTKAQCAPPNRTGSQTPDPTTRGCGDVVKNAANIPRVVELRYAKIPNMKL